jgi:hypothetical protein
MTFDEVKAEAGKPVSMAPIGETFRAITAELVRQQKVQDEMRATLMTFADGVAERCNRLERRIENMAVAFCIVYAIFAIAMVFK